MWYKPMECDVIVFACNAFTVAQLLREIDVGEMTGVLVTVPRKGALISVKLPLENLVP